MKKIITILFVLSVIFPFYSFSQERTDEVRKKLNFSVDGQSEKLSIVTGWSKLENKDGKFWKQSEPNSKKNYLPCCVETSEFEYIQTFQFSLEGEIFYLMVVKYSKYALRTFAFTSSSLKNLGVIINSAEGQSYNTPAIEFCQYYSSPTDEVSFDIEKAIENKEMIRLLLTGKGSSILSNDCKGNTIFKLSSQVLKGDTIVRFNNLPWQNNLHGTIPLTDDYFEVKRNEFMKLYIFTPYMSENGSEKLGSEIDTSDEQVFEVVEQMPEFQGGEKALTEFIAKAVKYPDDAIKDGIQGKVFISFVINKNGKVVDAKVVRAVRPSMDMEALRVVNSMPNWKPGKQNGKSVSVSYKVPINFP